MSGPRRAPVPRLAAPLRRHGLLAVASVVRALPPRWIPALSRALARVVAACDPGGRRVGRANLRLAFGEDPGPAARRRRLRDAFALSVSAALVLVQVAPRSPGRLRRWLARPGEDVRRWAASRAIPCGGVLVSAHVGTWTLLPRAADLMPRGRPLALAATRPSRPRWERWLAAVCEAAGAHGAVPFLDGRALRAHVAGGGLAVLFLDEDVPGEPGGPWTSFLGLPARTPSLPARLALEGRVPLHPAFCLPGADGRSRLWVGPDLAEDLHDRPAAFAVPELTRRLNGVLEDLVRARPDLWPWTRPRFARRPERELGPYPAYSRWDPESRALSRRDPRPRPRP